MNGSIGKIVVTLCVVAILGSLVAFLATGMHPYTRFRDQEIEAANAETGLSDLFADSGEAPPEAVESKNAIGFLPSGPGLSSISVVSISGPAVVVIGAVWWLGRRGKASGAPAGEVSA
jgi:hypothetical protein